MCIVETSLKTAVSNSGTGLKVFVHVKVVNSVELTFFNSNQLKLSCLFNQHAYICCSLVNSTLGIILN